MFVYIDTRTGGDCVSISVTPKMTANELRKRALKKSTYSGDASKFILHEVILGGEMERPIHYKELIYEVIFHAEPKLRSSNSLCVCVNSTR